MKGIYWGKSTDTPPENPQLRLRFDVDPMSCILTLADVLQDFGRLDASFSRDEPKGDDPKGVKVSYDAPCTESRLEYDKDSKTLTITYVCKYESKTVEKNMFLKKEKKELFDRKYGYLDLSALGVERVEMKAIYEKSS